jgi:cell division protein FtsW
MKKYIQSKKPDYLFMITVFALIFFGIIMISSSSVVASLDNTGKNYTYVMQQVVSLLVGLVAMYLTYRIDYRFWKKHSVWMIIITILLLVLVFVPGIGKSAGGAHRWISIFGTWFQPSELIKLTFIIYLSAWLDTIGDDVKNFWKGFIPFTVMIVIIGTLIMSQPDLGTMSVIMFSAVAIFYAAGAELTHMVMGAGSLIAAFIILIKTSPYRQQRLLVFLNPSVDTQGAAYHINQALLAVGAGGLWGLGFGQSRQKYLYLPEAHTDSIFAIVAEELGFIRSGLVVLGFLFLGYLGLRIAKNAPDRFSRFLAIGITTWIVVQAFINIGAMINILPLTGVPLPFISYGGSSLIVLLAAAGLMLNISKQTGESR